jgi:hypothetical protein
LESQRFKILFSVVINPYQGQFDGLAKPHILCYRHNTLSVPSHALPQFIFNSDLWNNNGRRQRRLFASPTKCLAFAAMDNDDKMMVEIFGHNLE